MKTKIIKEHGTKNVVGIYIDTYITFNNNDAKVEEIFDNGDTNNVMDLRPPYNEHIITYRAVECGLDCALLLSPFVDIIDDVRRNPSLLHANDVIALKVSANIYDDIIQALETLTNILPEIDYAVTEVAGSATYSDFVA